MKIIRWWGLIVFLVLAAILLVAWYLVAPKLIENSIEEIATEALGAKVDISNVELSLFPVSVAINQLHATDPDQPMKNIFESQKIKFAVDSKALLWKKIVIEELTISGVKTATARKTSGELVGGRKSTQAIQKAVELIVPEISKENINQLINKADLITLKRANQLKSDQARLKKEWQKSLDKDAFNARTEKIKSEFDRLSKRLKKNKLSLITDRKDWKKLKRSIDTERQQIKSLSGKLKQDKNNLSKNLKLVKQGPDDDLNKVMQQFGLGSGMEGLVDKYLGPQYTPWITKALELVKHFKPSEEESKTPEENTSIKLGKKVYFLDKQIFPEFLVKKVIIDGSDKDWNIGGNGFNLGYLPWLTGKPAKLNLKLGGKGQASLDLSSDWKSINKMSTKINSKINQWPVQAMQLMDTKQGQWNLNSGILSGNLQGDVSLESINLNASFSVTAPKLSFPDSLAGWQKALASSINSEQKISFKLTASGSIFDPKIKLDSSLEKLFQNAIGEKIKQKADKLKDEVKQKIMTKVGDISGLENFDGNFDDWQSQLADKDKLLEKLLGKIKI